MFQLDKLIRPHLLNLTPYSSARDEFSGEAAIFLDANENPFGSATAEAYNRYPDPYQKLVKEQLSRVKEIDANHIFLGNGSDEVIDLIIRMFCRPGKDNIIILPPTYGMYKVSADVNDVEAKEVLLTEDYQLDPEKVLKAVNEFTKVIFICSPNNPTGNLIKQDAIEKLLTNFSGIVVIDEAYIDFAKVDSWIKRLGEFPNLVVMQTFSKAWGLAALRLGMAFASKEVISILNKIKPPYNISEVTQQRACEALRNEDKKDRQVDVILHERTWLMEVLAALPVVHKVYPSDANFILLKVEDPKDMYNYMVKEQLIVRDRSKVALCGGCLRVTIGTPMENKEFIRLISIYQAEHKKAEA